MAIKVGGQAAVAQPKSLEQTKSGAEPAGPGSPFFREERPAGQRLPRLREALADPSFKPVDVMAVPVPDDVLSALRSAKRVMVVGHTASDADAVGSTLGLSRALRRLGKEVDSVIDDELSGQLRAIPGSTQVQRYGAKQQATDYDLVVMVDVAQAERIGKAAEALKKAPNVLVIDHHQTEPTTTSLAMRDGAKLTTWVESSADAASLLVAGVTERLLDGLSLSRPEQVAITGPELAGMFTDSGGFSYPGVDGVSLAIFKSELTQHFDGGLDALTQTIHYQLPELGKQLLSAPPDLSGLEAAGEAGQALLARARQALDDGLAPRVEDAANGGRVIVVPQAFVDLAFEAARLVDPAVVKPDIVGQLKQLLNPSMDEAHPWVAQVFGQDGKTYVSTRSREAGPAVHLAETLGGGGHDRASGAMVDAPVEDVVARVKKWAAALGSPPVSTAD